MDNNETNDAVPVVDGNGTPIVHENGDAVTSTDKPNTTTSAGNPAVAATPDNVPDGAKPDPTVTGSAPSIDTTAPAQPATQGSGVGAVAPAATTDAGPVVTANELADPNPKTNPNISDAAVTDKVPAMASDDPKTPNSVATDPSPNGSTETLNPALTTTVDATTLAKAKSEQDNETVAANTPAAVLGDAIAPGSLAASNVAADPTKPLVVAPGTGDGLAVSNAAPATQEGVRDIGAGAADASKHDVVVAAPAAGNATSDGKNAGAVDPTGYVAPVRVSAAGVPAEDPTLQAISQGTVDPSAPTPVVTNGSGVGDMNTSNAGGTGAAAPAPVVDRTGLGVDGTYTGTQSRLGGGAQNTQPSNPAPADPNAKAQNDALISAMTGAPSPASVNDTTLGHPVAAGDPDAAQRVADLHTADAPAPATPSAAPAPYAGGGDVTGKTDAPASTDAPLSPSEAQQEAVKVLDDAGVLPTPVLTDVSADIAGPQSAADLDTSAGPLFEVTYDYSVSSVYHVHAKDEDAAVQAVKDGKAFKLKDSYDEDWSGSAKD